MAKLIDKNENKLIFHLAALVMVFAWGVSFINTRVLLDNGLNPSQIYVMRFTLAYFGLLAVAKFRVKAMPWRDELLCAICGLVGGSVYFIAENTALKLTLVSNVAFIVTICPLLTTLLVCLVSRDEKFTLPMLIGSVMALLGVALLVFKDGISFAGSFLGDSLAFVAAICWSVYSLLLKYVMGRYPTADITRKVFFYGVITSVPFIWMQDTTASWGTLLAPSVWGNLLFLGLVCSLLAFIIWNVIVKEIGAIRASNYIYISPVVSVVASMIVLDERITLMDAAGSALILLGVVFAENYSKIIKPISKALNR